MPDAPETPLPPALATLELTPQILRQGRPVVPATTNDGASILLRPVLPADKPLFETGLTRLSAQSRHFRFLAGLSHFTPEQLSSFTEVDQVNRLCWIATTPDGREPIGVTRSLLLSEPPASAEFAVTVLDAWQRRGVVSRLLAVHALTARERGVKHFFAEISPENAAILGLLRSVGAIAEAPTRWRLEVAQLVQWAAKRFR